MSKQAFLSDIIQQINQNRGGGRENLWFAASRSAAQGNNSGLKLVLEWRVALYERLSPSPMDSDCISG